MIYKRPYIIYKNEVIFEKSIPLNNLSFLSAVLWTLANRADFEKYLCYEGSVWEVIKDASQPVGYSTFYTGFSEEEISPNKYLNQGEGI